MKPKLFLDMDGVLANLFDALGYKFHKKTYKELSFKEKKTIKKIWVDKKEFHKHFDSVESLFADIKPFGFNGQLTNVITETAVRYFGEYFILTHPTSIDRQGCMEGKKKWITNYLYPQPKQIYFPEEKSAFAEQTNILVDDFLPYIQAWKNKGGYAIQMRTDSFSSSKELETFLSQEFEKAHQTLVLKNNC